MYVGNNLIPTEIVALIVTYIPYRVMRNLRRTTNEMVVALARCPTGPAHVIHLAVSRFHWRWSPYLPELPAKSTAIGTELTTPLGSTREQIFIRNTLQFHRLWTGPIIPYASYVHDTTRYLPSRYVGPM